MKRERKKKVSFRSPFVSTSLSQTLKLQRDLPCAWWSECRCSRNVTALVTEKLAFQLWYGWTFSCFSEKGRKGKEKEKRREEL